MPSFSQSRFAVRLQNVVSVWREESGLYGEVETLLPPLGDGRLLDVGTGCQDLRQSLRAPLRR